MSGTNTVLTGTELLTPQETAQILRTTEAGLANLRYSGRGPVFIKMGRKVIYRAADIEAYVSANAFSRTDTRAAK